MPHTPPVQPRTARQPTSVNLLLLLSAFSASIAVALITVLVLWPTPEETTQAAGPAPAPVAVPSSAPAPDALPAVPATPAQPPAPAPAPPAPSTLILPTPAPAAPAQPAPVVAPAPVAGDTPPPRKPESIGERAIELARQEVFGRNLPGDRRREALYDSTVVNGNTGLRHKDVVKYLDDKFKGFWWQPLRETWDEQEGVVHQMLYASLKTGDRLDQMIFTRKVKVEIYEQGARLLISRMDSAQRWDMYRARFSEADISLAERLNDNERVRDLDFTKRLLLADRLLFYSNRPKQFDVLGLLKVIVQRYPAGKRDDFDEPSPFLEHPHFDTDKLLRRLDQSPVSIDSPSGNSEEQFRNPKDVLIMMTTGPEDNPTGEPRIIVQVLN